MSDLIRRRCVFHIGGYEPVTPTAFFARLARQLQRFDATWALSSTIEPHRIGDDGATATARITTSGPNWRVETDMTLLAWDSIVSRDFARPIWRRLALGLWIFADFVASGAAYRYFRHAWRFGLYFLYPFAYVALIALAGVAAGGVVATLVAAPILSAFLAIGVALSLFLVLLRWPGKRWFVSHTIDLWAFSNRYMHGARPDAEALFRRQAEAITRQVRAGGYDEVVLIGHSTGGGVIVDILAEALRIEPGLAGKTGRLALATVGSTGLKFGLHPAGKTWRDNLRRLDAETELFWVEYQAKTDLVNFYRTDPVRDSGIRTIRSSPFPLVRSVRIRDLLQPADYQRIKFNLFRVHYQFVMANTRRSVFDYFMICCGPIGLRECAEGKNTALTAIGPDGALVSDAALGQQAP